VGDAVGERVVGEDAVAIGVAEGVTVMTGVRVGRVDDVGVDV
jgi:hypothetical protein